MGWKAQYYANQDFTELLSTRDDGDVLNFNTSQPGNAAASDPLFVSDERESNGIAVRWMGGLHPNYSETYTFYASVDNVAQIWIDGVLKADLSLGGGAFTMALTAGHAYLLKVDYKNLPGSPISNPAVFVLEWQSASQSRQLIPYSSPISCGNDLSNAYKTHLQGSPTYRALIYKITRRDGQVFGFTNCVFDIDGDNILRDGEPVPDVAGVTFVAKSGMVPKGIASTSDLSPDNTEMEAFFDDDGITERDIEAGLFDDAEVLLMEVNYRDLTMGVRRLKSGWLGKVQWSKGRFTTELRAMSQRLKQNIIPLTSLNCRCVQFGDAKCKKDLSDDSADGFAITKNGTISSVSVTSPRRTFASTSIASYPANRFAYGRIRITNADSPNFGIERKIRSSSGSNLVLADTFPFDLQAGDTFVAICGCNRTIEMCGGIYKNAINFDGEPHIPGLKVYDKEKA